MLAERPTQSVVHFEERRMPRYTIVLQSRCWSSVRTATLQTRSMCALDARQEMIPRASTPRPLRRRVRAAARAADGRHRAAGLQRERPRRPAGERAHLGRRGGRGRRPVGGHGGRRRADPLLHWPGAPLDSPLACVGRNTALSCSALISLPYCGMCPRMCSFACCICLVVVPCLFCDSLHAAVVSAVQRKGLMNARRSSPPSRCAPTGGRWPCASTRRCSPEDSSYVCAMA